MTTPPRAARLGALLVLAALVRASASQAQPAPPLERARVSLGARLGLAKSPFPSADAREISGLLTSVLLEGEAQVGLRLAVRLRLPLVLAGVDQPAGGARASTTWGHPEAALLWRPREIAAAWLLARLALAVPLPSGGEATLARRPLDNQALVLASAQRGFHDQELYAPGRVALTPSARLDVRRGPVALFGEVKLPFMLALARGEADRGTSIRRLAIASAAAAGASVSWWRLRAGTTLWSVFDLLPAAELRGTAAGRWTMTIDPELSFRFNDHVGAGLTVTIPVAGTLPVVPALGFAMTGHLERTAP